MASESRRAKIVLASGVFDLLHLGHVKFLEAAKKAGGRNARLVVVVARDSTVHGTKGRKPVMSENQRLALVESLKVVDDAVLGLENFEVGEVIESIKPQVIALGYDQEKMERKVRDYIEKNQLRVEVVHVDKFTRDDLDSSSKIRQKIVEKFSR